MPPARLEDRARLRPKVLAAVLVLSLASAAASAAVGERRARLRPATVAGEPARAAPTDDAALCALEANVTSNADLLASRDRVLDVNRSVAHAAHLDNLTAALLASLGYAGDPAAVMDTDTVTSLTCTFRQVVRLDNGTVTAALPLVAASPPPTLAGLATVVRVVVFRTVEHRTLSLDPGTVLAWHALRGGVVNATELAELATVNDTTERHVEEHQRVSLDPNEVLLAFALAKKAG